VCDQEPRAHSFSKQCDTRCKRVRVKVARKEGASREVEAVVRAWASGRLMTEVLHRSSAARGLMGSLRALHQDSIFRSFPWRAHLLFGYDPPTRQTQLHRRARGPLWTVAPTRHPLASLHLLDPRPGSVPGLLRKSFTLYDTLRQL
jgi:hypothetical protein